MSKVDLSLELANINYYRQLQEDLVFDNKDVKSIEYVMGLYGIDLDNHVWGIPTRVFIPKDKPNEFREVFVFPDKDSILLKLINKIFNDKLSSKLSEHVYSYKQGVSTKTACTSIINAMQSDTINYVKLDISSYFNSVNAKTINKVLEELISDKTGLALMKRLFEANSYYDKNGIIVQEYLGLMPGTATSAFLSNYVLKEVDAELSKQVTFYARYSDDMILIDEGVLTLENNVTRLLIMLEDYGLKINSKKTEYFIATKEITFLGLKVTKDCIDMSTSNFKKLKARVKSICTKERKRLEIANRDITDLDLKSIIKRINKMFYQGYLSNKSLHRNSKLVFIFSNITTDTTLKQLDLYVQDTLIAFMTGKIIKLI